MEVCTRSMCTGPAPVAAPRLQRYCSTSSEQKNCDHSHDRFGPLLPFLEVKKGSTCWQAFATRQEHSPQQGSPANWGASVPRAACARCPRCTHAMQQIRWAFLPRASYAVAAVPRALPCSAWRLRSHKHTHVQGARAAPLPAAVQLRRGARAAICTARHRARFPGPSTATPAPAVAATRIQDHSVHRRWQQRHV
jgi:hypothetical protein